MPTDPSSKAKTRNRRLIILAVVAIVATGLIGLLYTQRQSQISAKTQEAHQLGIEAFEQGDYIQTVELLRDVVNQPQVDTEALFAFGRASFQVADPTGEIRGMGLQAFREAVRRSPEDLESSQELLGLMMLYNRADALSLADRIIQTHPDDLETRRLRTHLLNLTGRRTDALKAANEIIEENPLDLDMQILARQIRNQNGDNRQVMLQEAIDLREQFPEDPRATLIYAMALHITGDQTGTREHLRKAAEAPAPEDPNYPTTLIRFHDGLGMFPRSLELLRTYADPEKQSQLYDELIYRLFEHGRLAEAIDAIDKLPPEQLDAERLGMRAIASHYLKRPEQVETDLTQLEQRADGGIGKAWADMIRTMVSETPEGRAGLVSLTEQTAALAPANGYLQLVLGDALTEAGQSDKARERYDAAALRRPAWSLPRARLAGHELATGKPDAAARLASDALIRQPNSVNAAILLTLARGETLDENQPRQTRKLLQYVNAIQEAAPGEPNTAILGIRLHAILSQTDQARQLAEQLLQRESGLTRNQMLRLAKAASDHKLDLSDDIRAAVEARFGPSPELTMFEAARLADNGQVPAGLALLETGLQDAADEPRTQWALLKANYLERYAPQDAAANWKALADQYPDDAEIQAGVLRAITPRKDRAFTDQTIQRLQQLEGDNSRRWRAYRARYILTKPDPQDPMQDAQTAAQLLGPVIASDPSNVETHLLMAICQERLGNLDAAIAQVSAARSVAPRDPKLLLELARLQLAAGHNTDTIQAIEIALGTDQLTDEQRTSAAMMLASAGAGEEAVAMMLALRDQGKLSPRATLILARLLERTGQGEKLDDVIRSLVETPTPESLLFAAQYYTRGGEQTAAQSVLDRLTTIEMPTSRRHALMAEHYITAGNHEAALTHLHKATELTPQDPQRWHRLAGYLLSIQQPQQALVEARRGLRSIPDEPALSALIEREGMVLAAGQNAGFTPLFNTLIHDETHREAATQVLDVLARARAEQQKTLEVAEELLALSEENPQFVTLQILTIGLLINANQVEDAAQLAQTMMARHPDVPETAGIAAEALLLAERWEQALVVAMNWRQKSRSGDTQGPDIAIARAKLGLQDPRSALGILNNYRQPITAHPDANREAMLALIRALIGTGQVAEAQSLIGPLARESDAWRLEYMRLGASEIRNTNQALRWLVDPAGTPPADQPGQHLGRVQAVLSLAQRTNNAQAYDTARQLIERILAAPDAPAIAWFLRGNIGEFQNDFDAAERAYRQAHELDPTAEVYANNLAMAIAHQGENLGEAEQIVTKLIEEFPSNANLLDTLAFILLKADQCERALAAIDKAIELEPAEVEWRERRSQIQAHCNSQPTPPEPTLPGEGTQPE